MRSSTPKSRWRTGFLIGARGELVFGRPSKAERKTGAELQVVAVDGRRMKATVLGYEPASRLAVARIDPAPSGLVPARVGASTGLRRHSWVMVLKHNRKGLPEPFAGTVESGLRRIGKSDSKVLDVDVPGAPGSPIFSIQGALVGVALDRGRRRTRMVAIESVMPFIKGVVVGSQAER